MSGPASPPSVPTAAKKSSAVPPVAAAKVASKKPTTPKGPPLYWNQDRSYTLIYLLRVEGVRTMPDLIRGLQSSPAFAGETAPITPIKVRNQIERLNKDLSEPLPKLSGPGRQSLDFTALNAIGLPGGAEAQ